MNTINIQLTLVMMLFLSTSVFAQENAMPAKDESAAFVIGGNLHASLQKWGESNPESTPESDNESNWGYGAGGLLGAGVKLDPTTEIIGGFHFQLNHCEWNYTNSTTGGIENVTDKWEANLTDIGLGFQAVMDDTIMTAAFGFSRLSMTETIDGVEYPAHIYDGDKGKCSFVDIGIGFKSESTTLGYFFASLGATFYKGTIGEKVVTGGNVVDQCLCDHPFKNHAVKDQ